jgi:surface repeat SSSPR-51 protein
MKLRKLLTVGLLTSTLLSPLTAFAETKTKDITDPKFLEFVEQLRRENPKLEIVEDEPITVHTEEEAKQRESEQKVTLETTKTEVNEKLAEYAAQKKAYDEALEKYKQDKITYDELWTLYSAQKEKYDADIARNKELKAENERLTAEYNAKKQQYDTDLAAYNQRNQEIADVTNRNETKKTNWQNDVARITASNKQIKANYEKQLQDAKNAHDQEVTRYEQEKSEYDRFIENNPVLLDGESQGIVVRGTYNDNARSVDKGESTVYKNWWIANNQSAVMGTPDASQMNFHNYGNGSPTEYFNNVYTMYNKEKLAELGYEYSLGDIGITNQTTMNITYKDSRVTEYDNQYGHNYKLAAQGQVVDNFLKFDLHNLGTTASGKTISAHVTVSKWHQSRASAVYTFRKDGTLGAFEDGARATYQFYDEATGKPIKLVRMFVLGDLEAGENLGVSSNGIVKAIVPIAPSDKARGITEGQEGYTKVQQMNDYTAWTFGDEHMANLNHSNLPNDPATVGNNYSVQRGISIGIFTGDTVTASWSGAGGGFGLNNQYIEFKSEPTPPAVWDESLIPTPKYEKIPDEPTYEEVPTPLENPVKPEEPTLNTIVDPTAPVEPNMANPVAPTNAPAEVENTEVRFRRVQIVQYDTNWVDEDGNVLKDKVTGNTTQEHGDIDSYSFVKSTTDEDGNVTHIFRQYTTKWVDEDGNELKTPVKGSKTVEIGDAIPEYYYVETKKDDKDNVTYVFRQVKTSYVTEEGKELAPTEKGTHKEKGFVDYSFRTTEVDDKGNTKHIYKLLHTIYVDESGKELSSKDVGQQNPKSIPDYSFKNTELLLENGIIKHVYRQVNTSWKTTTGAELKPNEKGAKDPGTFTGYKLVRTETKENGDVVHIFEKNDDIPTGVNTNAGMFSLMGMLSLLGLGAVVKNKRVRD